MCRACLDCGVQLRGRADKKFCDDICRSSFNNAAKMSDDLMMRAINQTLRKNRRILKTLNPTGQNTIKMMLLAKQGFDFDYHTHRVLFNGKTYFCCYEFGYTLGKNDEIELVSDEAMTSIRLYKKKAGTTQRLFPLI